MLKKYCLVGILLASLPWIAFGKVKPKSLKCDGYYDVYDDTCYFKGGAFVFFGYNNGKREVTKNGKTIRYFFWFNGAPYRSRYWPFL